jgi:hypothetical protein
MTKENRRRSEWGKGWDGRSRIPDDKFKKNYDEIDWSYVLTPEQHETNLLEKEIKRKYDSDKSTDTSKNSKG